MSTTGGVLASLSLFNGHAPTRGTRITAIDAPANYAAGYAVGLSDGLGRGMTIARGSGGDDLEAGIRAALEQGIARGMAIARGQLGDEIEESVQDALAQGILIGSAAATAAGGGGGSGETDPPIDDPVSPSPATAPGAPGGFPGTAATARDVPIVIDVLDAESEVVFVVLSVRYAGAGPWESVYSGRPAIDGTAEYRAGYAAFSDIIGTGAPGVGFRFSVRADAGWPMQSFLTSTIELNVQAVDSEGNVLP